MTKKTLKIISMIFGLIAIYNTINLILDKTEKKQTSLSKEYELSKNNKISEKFVTDFESSYGIHMELMDTKFTGLGKTILPIDIELNLYQDNKPVELFGDYKQGYLIINNTAQLTSFMSNSGTEYELKISLSNNKTKAERIRLDISPNVPGPSYAMLIEREFKWVFWCINGLIILIALITGYFGFRRKSSR